MAQDASGRGEKFLSILLLNTTYAQNLFILDGDNKVSSGPKVSECLSTSSFVNLNDPETWGKREGECPIGRYSLQREPTKYLLEGGEFGSGVGVKNGSF